MVKKKEGRMPLHEPFDMTLVLNVSGITYSDGKVTLTPKMIIDQVTDPLVKHQFNGLIRDWQVKVEINNIVEAKKTIAKSRKEY